MEKPRSAKKSGQPRLGSGPKKRLPGFLEIPLPEVPEISEALSYQLFYKENFDYISELVRTESSIDKNLLIDTVLRWMWLTLRRRLESGDVRLVAERLVRKMLIMGQRNQASGRLPFELDPVKAIETVDELRKVSGLFADIFALRFAGLNYAEMASSLKISEDSVRKSLRIATSRVMAIRENEISYASLKGNVKDALLGPDSRLPSIIERATEVIGDRQEAMRWLGTPVRGLDYATPISLLATDEGAERVSDILGQIEHGVW